MTAWANWNFLKEFWFFIHLELNLQTSVYLDTTFTFSSFADFIKIWSLELFFLALVLVLVLGFRYLNFDDCPTDADGIPVKKKEEIPLPGTDPRWDHFLREALRALGITLAEASGSLLLQIWFTYKALVITGIPFAIEELIVFALEDWLKNSIYFLPLFILSSVLVAYISYSRKMYAIESIKNAAKKK